MKWFINLGIRKKFMLIFTTALLLLIVTGFIGVRGSQTAQDIIDEINEKNIPCLNYLLQADRDLYQLLTAERSLLSINSSNPEFAKILKDYEENLNQSRERLNQYKELVTGWREDALNLFLQYEKLRKEWEPLSQRVINERKTPPAAPAPTEGETLTAPPSQDPSPTTLLSIGQTSQKFLAMRDIIDQLEDLHEKQIHNYHNEAEDHNKTVLILISAISAASVLFALLAWFLLNSAVSRNVDRMILHARDLVEGEGDLTRRILVESADEIGRLGEWFNRFIERIEHIIANTKNTTSQLTASAEEVTAGGESLAVQTNEQAAAVTQTSTTIEEFSTILRQNSKNSEETNDMLKEFNEEVQQRKELIDNVTATMQEIYESGKKIDAIVNVINDISFQTNLLALNAAVEAARAGEAGRGFAVVAAEVRSLAQKTAESSKSIREIVSQNVQSTGKGSTLVKQTSEFFETILQVLGDISEKVQIIANGSREQSNGVEQINQTISQLDSVINQNAQLVDKFANAAKNLKINSYELKEVVDSFKTSDSSPAAPTERKKKEPLKPTPIQPAAKKTDKPTPPTTPTKETKTPAKDIKKTTTAAKSKPKPEPAAKPSTPPPPSTRKKPAEEADFFSSDEENFEEF